MDGCGYRADPFVLSSVRGNLRKLVRRGMALGTEKDGPPSASCFYPERERRFCRRVEGGPW